jgi:glutathione S-transferase
MVLNELKLDGQFTLYQPDVLGGEVKQPALTAKQPFGVVPVLEDGEFRIYGMLPSQI